METGYQYKCRHVARIVIEALTPIKVGSGDKSVITDSTVVTDANGLPYIPGTSLAGVFRNFTKEVDSAFGSQEAGSRMIFTDAKVMDSEGKVADGFVCADDDRLLAAYQGLPVRDHVRIGHDGTAVDGAKFDEQVVCRGARFCFEVEYLAESNDDDSLLTVLAAIYKDGFRLGGGSRRGFGQVEVVSAKVRKLLLPQDLEDYLSKSSELVSDEFWKSTNEWKPENIRSEEWKSYTIELTPKDFILCGSGKGDSVADMTPVKELCVVWDGNSATTKELYFIPGASIKGALSHRTAYYYNKSQRNFATSENVIDLVVGTNNQAVCELFGSAGDAEGQGRKRGNIMISDFYFQTQCESIEHLFNHVVIDSFSGGAIEGGLFAESVLYLAGVRLLLNLSIKSDLLATEYGEAFKKAVADLCLGMLPIGGGVNRGHGRLSGEKPSWN